MRRSSRFDGLPPKGAAPIRGCECPPDPILTCCEVLNLRMPHSDFRAAGTGADGGARRHGALKPAQAEGSMGGRIVEEHKFYRGLRLEKKQGFRLTCKSSEKVHCVTAHTGVSSLLRFGELRSFRLGNLSSAQADLLADDRGSGVITKSEIVGI